MAEDFNITEVLEENAFYSNQKEELEFLHNTLTGGFKYVEQYLVKHTFETSADFINRQKRAFYYDVLRQIGDFFVQPVFTEGVLRRNIEDIMMFIEDASGYGDSLENVLSELGVLSAVFGNSFLFLDNSIDEELVDENERFPVVNIYSPFNMINWERKKRYGFTYCVFKEKKMVDGNLEDVFIVVTAEKIYEVDSNGNDIVEPYEHNLGYVPVFELVFPSSYKYAGRKGFLDVAYLSKFLLNFISLVDELGERQAFYQLAVPDDGTIEELKVRQSDYLSDNEGYVGLENESLIDSGYDPVLEKLKKSRVFTFPAQTGHPPNYLTTATRRDVVGSIWGVVSKAVLLCMFTKGICDLKGNLNISRINNVVALLSRRYETLEKKLLKTVYRYLDRENNEIIVVYPDSFSRSDMTLKEWLGLAEATSKLKESYGEGFAQEFFTELMAMLPLPITQEQKMQMAKSVILGKSE